MKPSRSKARWVTAVVLTGLLLGAAPARAGEGEASAPPRKSHGGIGALVGSLAGLGLGVIMASKMDCYDDCTGPVLVVFGGGIVGGLLGYAAGGGFASNTERALDQGRERVREALAARATEASCADRS